MDPNLSAQLGLNRGGVVRTQSTQNGAPGAGFVQAVSDEIDATPRIVAGFVLGAAVTLFLLRAAGFRFSFGASVGGGS